MKVFGYAIVFVNFILFALFWWMYWMSYSHLPGQLNARMSSDVMLQKYHLVCARLTASMASMFLLAIVLINVVLIYMYSVLNKSLSPAPSAETPLVGTGQHVPTETDSGKS